MKKLSFTEGKTRVVGVVSDAEAWGKLSQQKVVCDVVELRVDALPQEVRAEINGVTCPAPLLLTLRHRDEGGQAEWTEEERRALALKLLPAAAALDWEIAHMEGAGEVLAAAHACGAAVIASAHYFHSMPTLGEMLELAKKAQAAGADVVKIAFTPGSEDDLAIGDQFLQDCGMPAAIMGMGELAAASRRRYTAQGSVLLYGYLQGAPTAPGQLSAEECCRIRDAVGCAQ